MTVSEPNRTEKVIPLERIFLHNKNPRHEPFDTQAQIIEYLCENENVKKLAYDIVRNGLSPLDRFGVKPDDENDADDATYIAVEGNRRLCALKLLSDPDLAPTKLKEFFQEQSENWTPITELPCVIFTDLRDIDLWLKRRHHGPEGGIGQKPWNAEQKARHSGADSRNRVAQQFLDWAEQENLISSDDRKRRLTTVARYLSNAVMRETLGLDKSDPDDLKRNRAEEDFRILSQKFISDMLANIVNSRQNKDEIENYARKLSSQPNQSRQRIEDPEPIILSPQKPKPSDHLDLKLQKPPTELPNDRTDIDNALGKLNNRKLSSLYASICNISLRDHTPLLAIGVWAFFETLTAKLGRSPKADFHSFLCQHFLNPNKLMQYGLGAKEQVKPLREALARIRDYGNTTKHHYTSAAFNADQLHNDMETLGDLILILVNEAVSKK